MNNERILANIKAKKLSLSDLLEVSAAGSTTYSTCASGSYDGHHVDGWQTDVSWDT